MLPGSGTFTVTLPVETTKSGQFDATYLSMNYTLGAPNLAPSYPSLIGSIPHRIERNH